MEVSLESSEGLHRKLKISIPAEKVESKIKQKLTELLPKLNIKGFRPGKVPFNVAEKHCGDGVRQEVLSELMRETLFDAIKEQSLQPAGTPSVAPSQAIHGEAFEYLATFEVMPEITLKTMKEKYGVPVTAGRKDSFF